jgi:hypothetical protein
MTAERSKERYAGQQDNAQDKDCKVVLQLHILAVANFSLFTIPFSLS